MTRVSELKDRERERERLLLTIHVHVIAILAPYLHFKMRVRRSPHNIDHRKVGAHCGTIDLGNHF